LSICVGSFAFAGGTTANADSVRIVSDEPVAGTGTVTVNATVEPNETVNFQIADTDGVVSATASVTEGGPQDLSPTPGYVEAELDLSTLFEETPATGSGTVYVATGNDRDPATGSFEAKRGLVIDSTKPFVSVQSGASASQGDQIKLVYTATDEPQAPTSITLEVLDANGDVYRTFGGLAAGEDEQTQFVLSNFSTGTYDLRITAVDAAGHTTTDTLVDGLVVSEGSGGENSVQAIAVASEQPVDGRDDILVNASVSTAGETASFVVEDVNGTRSATKTVTDGGPADLAPERGLVTAALDPNTLFATTPDSGVGTLYAGGGFGFNVSEQGFEKKTAVTIDSEAPGVSVVAGDSVKQGATALITYDVTSDLQNVESIELTFTGPDGTVYQPDVQLQTGVDNGVQVDIPADRPVATYDVTVTAVDSVGYVGSDTLVDGLNVTEFDGKATDFEVQSSDPIAGDGTLTVTNDMSVSGENVTYRVVDASGTASATRTVTDGGPADAEPEPGKVRTTLDLSELYTEAPATGTALVYVAAGESINVSAQAFDAKKQFTLDSTAPTATVESGAVGTEGDKVKIGYTASDEPQGLASISLELVGENGTVYEVPGDFQAGTGNEAQFDIRAEWEPGTYDIRLVVVDEVGYWTTDVLVDGFVVR
jgi:hypothetical protein